MHNLVSVLEDETHKLLWDFEIQTDHPISARRPDLEIIIKKTNLVNCVPADHRVKLKETKKEDKYLDLARELKKTNQLWNGDGDTNYNWCTWYSHQRISKGTGGLGNKRTCGNIPHCWDRPEYWEESWRLEEACCHSNFNDKPSLNACVKNSKRSKQ